MVFGFGTSSALPTVGMSSDSPATLDYQAPRRRYDGPPRDSAKSRLGVASCTCWGVSVACVGLTFFVAATDPGRGAFAAVPMVTLVLIAWVSSIVGTFIGMLGALPLDRRGEFALAGMILNGITCLCPFALCVLNGGPPC